MMFVPDKPTAMREARRVLKPGGTFLFSVWDSLAANPQSGLAHREIVAFTEPNPIRFYETPFGFSDEGQMRGWLSEAGFEKAEMIPVEFDCVSPTAHDAASGLVLGTPVVVAMKERDRDAIPKLVETVAQALAQEFGEKPCRGRMRALVWRAIR
jgi:ubiquinone/menaquinone biosynthesis C-methylase UbiE